jgi:hypothetical protein
MPDCPACKRCRGLGLGVQRAQIKTGTLEASLSPWLSEGVKTWLVRDLDIDGLRSARGILDFKRNALPFLQGPESIHLDVRLVNEHVLAAVVGRDKAIPLGIAEKLNLTSHDCLLSSPPIEARPRPVSRTPRYAGRRRLLLHSHRGMQNREEIAPVITMTGSRRPGKTDGAGMFLSWKSY